MQRVRWVLVKEAGLPGYQPVAGSSAPGLSYLLLSPTQGRTLPENKTLLPGARTKPSLFSVTGEKDKGQNLLSNYLNHVPSNVFTEIQS